MSQPLRTAELEPGSTVPAILQDERHGQMDAQERGRFTDFLLRSLNHNIALADRKASIVFTLATAVIVFILQHDPAALRGDQGTVVQAKCASCDLTGHLQCTVAGRLLVRGCHATRLFTFQRPKVRSRDGDGLLLLRLTRIIDNK